MMWVDLASSIFLYDFKTLGMMFRLRIPFAKSTWIFLLLVVFPGDSVRSGSCEMPRRRQIRRTRTAVVRYGFVRTNETL